LGIKITGNKVVLYGPDLLTVCVRTNPLLVLRIVGSEELYLVFPPAVDTDSYPITKIMPGEKFCTFSYKNIEFTEWIG